MIKISVVSVTKNEEKILPFFLDYYQNCIGVNKIILYDGNSTDNTIKIAQENPLVELVIQDHEKCDERDLMWVRNESWKKIRNEYDWIIVCDVDEFLYHPEFRKKLEEYTSKGVTIPLVEGFDMISDEFPKFKKGSFLPDLIKTGTKDSVFLNKNIIFNSKEIDINYQFGCHSCQPIGNIVWSDKWDFKLLHYKWLSYEYVVKKTSYQYNRLSDYSLINNFGVHNKQFSETTYSDFQNRFLNSGNVITGKKHRMRYLDIDGWFDFENIYENVIKNKGDNLKILELGAWLGKSTSFMAEIIKESEKIVDFYVVDHWKGDPNIGDLHGRFPELQGDNVYPIFEKNVGDLINYMKVITAESEDASKKFPDKYFDFIFLDATKIYEDVLRDISIWYPKIKDDGVFGGHDYFSWGGVKKAVDQFARDNQLIVKTNKSSWLLEKEKGLKIFWHCYLINEWPEIFEEQMILIKESGLYDKLKTESIRLHYYGDREQSNKLFNLVNKHDRDGKIILNYIQNNNYEYPTIQELHKFSLENHSYVLYLHLKGVWSTADASKNKEAIISWRKCLEYFNIEKWSDCVQKLNEGYDVVGALYNYDEKEPLFRGNIWWSTTEHIKKLKYPEYDASKNPYPEDDGTWCRVECEKWINTIPNKFYNFYTAKDYGFYYVPIEEKDYRKELTELMGKYRMFFIQDDCGGVNRLFGLKDLIDENVNKNDVICEVGSFEGVSSELFSIYCKELYCVDYWDIKEDVNIPIAEERFNNMIKKHKNIKKIKKSSEEAVKDFENEYFDLVYIDASHEYEDVKKDILNWSPKIKNGGILSGHDYNMDFVKKAVNEFFPKSSIKIYRDSSWCVKIGMDKNKKLNDLLRKPRMFFNDNPDGNINTLYGLKDLIEENINEDSIVCEIGSFAGVSSELFSLYCKEIHCVDNWDSNDEIWWMKEYIEKAEKFFDDVMNRSSNIRKIKKTSENASMDYPNEYFDLVYIDGAHDYENVKKDILNWLPKVKESGVISGHDYYAFQNNEDTDVKKVIDELFEYVEVKIYGDSSWVIKKSDTLKKIALVCIAKDEDHYIDEWIKYNKKLGFDRIFIYENDWKSGINLPYVTKIDWPGECVQLSAYNDFIDKYKKEYDYVAFFDCDEFLVLKKHKNVHDFVKEYGGKNIAINWQLYGSDGKFERDGSRSLLKSFTKRQFDVDRHVKTIMYLKKDSRMMIVHHPDTQVFDTNGKSFIESYNKNGPTDVAVINHYRDKTLEDYRLRVKRGYADAKREDDIENWFLRKDSDNDVDDFAACDFMYKPKISVIIPTYERLNSLTECIESVVKQNYDNLEILVCHDGPSENFEKYRFDDDRIKFFQTEKKENKYGTEARNLLLKKAEGDYVIFLDDDNLLYDDYLNKMTSLIDDRTGMVVCRIHFNDKNWTNLILPRKNEILPCEIDSLNVLIESSVAKSVKWDNIDIGHDHRYITACEKSIKEKGMDVKYVSDILAVHRYLGEKSERPIVVFSHNYLFGNWIGIVKEQFSLLISSGLYDKCKHVYMSVTTESKTYIADERSVFTELIKSFDVNNKVTITINNENNFEYDCLQFMSEYSEGNPSDICYYHTKGVFSENIPENIGVKSWRDYLNHFTITKWKDNVNKLHDGFDVVGVNYDYNDMHGDYVIGGNFFWTKSEYLKTLPYPDFHSNRFNAERWILKNENRKVCELFNTSKLGFKNLYMEYLNPNLYRNSQIEEIVDESFKKYSAQQNKHEYIEFLKKLIEKGKTGSVLEIGSKYGGTTYGFCKVFDEVVSIDILKENQIDEIEKQYKNLTFILGDSHLYETRNKLNGMKFDVVFIDGDHHYDAAKQDYFDYKEFVKQDGVIVFHNIKRTEWTDMIGIQVPILWNEIKHDYRYEEIINDENDCFGIGLLYKKEIEANEKTVFVMTSHPSYRMSEVITKEAIKSIKPNKIILSSHCPVSEDIQKSVDHYVYDKNNPLIRHDFFTQSWYDREDYFALVNITKNDNNFNHSMGVYLNYYNSLIYAKSLGYETAVCTNFDLIFHTDDMKTINEKISQMKSQGKKAFFMNTPEIDGEHFKTIFFITNIDFFLENFKYVTIEKDYTEETKFVDSNTNCLENFVFHTLKNRKNELLLQTINENELFSKSKINLFSLIEYNTVLPYFDSKENHDPNYFVAWFSSMNSLDQRRFEITIKKNGFIFLTDTDTINNQFIYYKKVRFEKGDVFEINFKTKDNNEIIKDKTVFVNDEIMSEIITYGKFLDKKR